jgi:ABC-type dipeptide/oligopeptide/nickel transport system permease subunit
VSTIDATTTLQRRGGRKRRLAFLRTGRGIVGIIVLLFVIGVAFIGPLVAPHPLDAPIGAPGDPPGMGAPLGTDVLGRDVLSRLLHGGTGVLEISLVTTVLIYAVGVTVGMIAGLSRSLLDPLLMRTVDIFLVFPPLVLILLLFAGAGQGNVVLVIGIVLVLAPGVARLVRTATLEVSTNAFIEAAVARGERTVAIMRREVLPNIAPSIIADVGVRFSGVIILAASVQFLGLGAHPPAANWGLMIAENLEVLSTNIWSVLAPAIMLGLLTVSVNLLGEAYIHTLGRTTVRR